jgi:hypothetical protein
MQISQLPRRRTGLTFLVLAIVAAWIGIALLMAQAPDVTLTLDRRIRSSLSPERLERNIGSPCRWTQWFYSLAQVNGPDTIEKGALFTLHIDPNKGNKKKFELEAQVIDYIPSRLLHLKITRDSSGRLTHLFDQLEWKIEIDPIENGAVLHGMVLAHTHHWRARLFGRLAEKILMNQVFYPNLIQLADLKQPFKVDEAPHLPAGSL